MTKAELIGAVAEKTELSKKQSDCLVNAFFSCVAAALVSDGKVSISGFGTFEVRDRKEKQVINPRTKEKMTAPASKAPAFKAGPTLKSAVNK